MYTYFCHIVIDKRRPRINYIPLRLLKSKQTNECKLICRKIDKRPIFFMLIDMNYINTIIMYCWCLFYLSCNSFIHSFYTYLGRIFPFVRHEKQTGLVVLVSPNRKHDYTVEVTTTWSWVLKVVFDVLSLYI